MSTKSHRKGQGDLKVKEKNWLEPERKVREPIATFVDPKKHTILSEGKIQSGGTDGNVLH